MRPHCHAPKMVFIASFPGLNSWNSCGKIDSTRDLTQQSHLPSIVQLLPLTLFYCSRTSQLMKSGTRSTKDNYTFCQPLYHSPVANYSFLESNFLPFISVSKVEGWAASPANIIMLGVHILAEALSYRNYTPQNTPDRPAIRSRNYPHCTRISKLEIH